MTTTFEPAWARDFRAKIAMTSPVTTARDVQRAQVGALDPDAFQIPAWWTALSIAGTALGAYHGYKRNNSIGWAIGWGLLGGAFPFIVIPVAYAQGIGDKA